MTIDERSAPSDAELVEAYPGYAIDRDNAPHFRGWLERRIVVNRCVACGEFHQPPQGVCPSCWDRGVVQHEISGRGTIELAATLHLGAPGEGIDYRAGHTVVVVRPDEAPSIRLSFALHGLGSDSDLIGRNAEVVWISRSGSPVPSARVV